MRVTFNMAFRNGVHDINQTALALAEAQREVSSGRRVHVPSDDPSAAAAIVGERAEERTLDTYRRMSDSVDSRLRVADTVLGDIISTLTTAQVKTAAARVSFATPEQREALALELEGLRDTIFATINTEFRGTYMFSGTQSTTPPYSKNASGVVQAYAGNADSQWLDIDRSQAVEVTFDGSQVIDDLFVVFDQLVADVRAGNTPGLQQGMDELGEAFQRVTTAQSRVGHYLSALGDQQKRLSEMKQASETRRSALEDANMAESITRMQQADAAYQAALGAVATTSRLSLMDYLR
jgi:flagellar hook-associated protein 3 FlgL